MKILFITHETSRSGAPNVLLHLFKWLQKHKPYVNVSVLALKEGALRQDFITSCHQFYSYEALVKPEKLTFVKRFLKSLGLYNAKNSESVLIKTLALQDFDVIYANTILSISFGCRVKDISKNTRLIAHIHESNTIIQQLLPKITDYLEVIDHVIAPSNMVRDNLIDCWKAKPRKITRVYECAEMKKRELSKHENNNSFIVGASGYVHWRKGYDVFLQVARYIKTHFSDKDIKFVWVGTIPLLEQPILEEDVRKLGLQEVIEFIGEVSKPSVFYNTFDVFLLCSREDPFPLVCIEVGQLGKPIISFENATGSNEIIEKGGGFIVPYLNIEAMAEKIVYYMDNPEQRFEHGQINIEEFSKFSPELICPQLYALLTTKLVK